MKRQHKPTIHPNANRKLVRFFRRVKRETHSWNIRETARRRDVNVKYVYDNLIHGIEPPDTTDKGRQARVKIFLKEHNPKPRKERKPLTRMQKAIMWMVKETKAALKWREQ
jgi:hypothetical protein